MSAARSVKLGDYFGERPVLLVLHYSSCPMLCNQLLIGFVASLKPLQETVGREFDVVAVSFDPKETPERAATSKDKYAKRYGRDGAGAGFHFLTGTQASIDALTSAVGFRYEYDEELEQYAHASGVTVLTPSGEIARYFFGTEFPPRDLRLAMNEATDGKLGSLTDELLLLCYRYDPATGTLQRERAQCREDRWRVDSAGAAHVWGWSWRRGREETA